MPDGVFAGKVRVDQSHVQSERASRNSGKVAPLFWPMEKA